MNGYSTNGYGHSTNGCVQWMDTVLMDMVDGYSTNGCGGWTKHTDIIQTISNLLSIFMAYIFFVSFIRTSCTSPNAPRPII